MSVSKKLILTLVEETQVGFSNAKTDFISMTEAVPITSVKTRMLPLKPWIFTGIAIKEQISTARVSLIRLIVFELEPFFDNR